MRGLSWGVFLILVCSLVAPAATVNALSSQEPENPVRILIVGDSVTQGSSGDWTWRYRLWKHLQASNLAVDFVGPRDDLRGLGPDREWTGDYLDPDFDRDHAARWGMAMAFQDVPIRDLVNTYHPDIVVQMLGVNDLVWLGVSPETLDGLARAFISDARSADPDVAVVMSRVPQQWLRGASDYNARMAESVAEFTTQESPLEVAYTDNGFRDRQHTWDPAHPNAAGEFLLAAAVGDALARLGVGQEFERPLPTVPLGPRRAPRLSGTSGDGHVALSWSADDGTTSQIIEGRDMTAGTTWTQWDEVIDRGEWQSSAENGHRYEFRLRPVKGYWGAASDVRSNTVTLSPISAAVATLTEIHVSASSFGRVLVSWSRVPSATAYQVRYREIGTQKWSVRARKRGLSLNVKGLHGRHRYEFQVRSWTHKVAGSYAGRGVVRIPPARSVKGLRATSPRRDRVKVVARPRPEVSRYRFQAVGVGSCRVQPKPSSFKKSSTVRIPRTRFTTKTRFMWVRVVGMRGGTLGSTGPRSTVCLRVK